MQILRLHAWGSVLGIATLVEIAAVGLDPQAARACGLWGSQYSRVFMRFRPKALRAGVTEIIDSALEEGVAV